MSIVIGNLRKCVIIVDKKRGDIMKKLKVEKCCVFLHHLITHNDAKIDHDDLITDGYGIKIYMRIGGLLCNFCPSCGKEFNFSLEVL